MQCPAAQGLFCLPRRALLTSCVPQLVTAGQQVGDTAQSEADAEPRIPKLSTASCDGAFHPPASLHPKATCSLTRPARMRDGELDIHHAAVWIRELEKPPPNFDPHGTTHDSIDDHHGSSSRTYLTQGGFQSVPDDGLLGAWLRQPTTGLPLFGICTLNPRDGPYK